MLACHSGHLNSESGHPWWRSLSYGAVIALSPSGTEELVSCAASPLLPQGLFALLRLLPVILQTNRSTSVAL